MQNLQNELIELLKNEDNLVVDNLLNKNKIIEAALKVEPFLIKLLIKNVIFKKYFFKDIENVLVFDKIKFQRFVNNKSFLPDSYTAFKNKIGLTINDETTDSFIKSKNDVVLVWPHKDCIFEGGQTKDDQNRNEIFWNEILAPDNVDRLLDAKVLTNFKKFDKDGNHKITELKGDENLIIKGNNLLALSSLLKTHRGKIKLIYIDPPYNTGSDSFGYNDNFNHSTWLTFMKNRLTIAKDLLQEDGFILVQCDDNEQAYLKVLMDEIFGRMNFDNCITTIVKTEGRRYGNLAKTHEYILMYAKNIINSKANEIEKKGHKFKYEDKLGGYDLTDLRNQNAAAFNSLNRPNLRYPFYVNSLNPDFNHFCEVSLEKKENWLEVYPITVNNNKSVWRWGKEKSNDNSVNNLIARKSSDGIFRIFQKYRSNTTMEKTVWFDKKFISNKGTKEMDALFGEKVFDFPKSEHLLKNIIQICTNENDTVLDFHLGSGTTAAVAHKMNRKYIGIEQMDYINTVTTKRLQKVIEGEQGGISNDIEWKGGGSFVYAELMEQNQKYISQIQEAKTKEAIIAIYNKMEDKAFLSFQFNKDIFNERLNAFKTASLEIMQQYLVELLDKNQLYVNFSEIEDETFAVSNEDKALNYSFYKANK
jgi:adenine-specific DNA-methyltransferase